MCAKLHLIRVFWRAIRQLLSAPPKKIPTTAYREAAVGITLSEVGEGFTQEEISLPEVGTALSATR